MSKEETVRKDCATTRELFLALSRYYIPLSCGGASHFRRRLSAKRAASQRARGREKKREGREEEIKKQVSPINLADATPPCGCAVSCLDPRERAAFIALPIHHRAIAVASDEDLPAAHSSFVRHE